MVNIPPVRTGINALIQSLPKRERGKLFFPDNTRFAAENDFFSKTPVHAWQKRRAVIPHLPVCVDDIVPPAHPCFGGKTICCKLDHIACFGEIDLEGPPAVMLLQPNFPQPGT